MWMALGADSTLALQIMEMIIEKLSVMVPYVDKKESMLRPGLTKVATSHPLAVSFNIFRICIIWLLKHITPHPNQAQCVNYAASSNVSVFTEREVLHEATKSL